MAMTIGLGIDVDSTSVERGAVALDKYGRELKDVEQGLRGVEGAGNRGRDALGRFTAGAGGAKVGLASVRGETTAFGRAMSDARTQSTGFAGSLGILRTAIAGLGIGLVIRDMAGFVTELSRIKSTLEQVSGSAAAGGAEFEYLRETSERLGISYLGVAGTYSKMLAAASAANIPLEQTRTLFEGVTAASVRFGLSKETTAGAFTALQQMISKGKVTAEELTGQLAERLPGAIAIAAEAMNMSTGELFKAMEDGKVSAAEFVDKFGQEMLSRFGEAAEGMDTVTTRSARLSNAMNDLRMVVADGGFEAAMMDVIGALTEFAKSDEAEVLARDLAQAFGELGGAAVDVIGAIGPVAGGISSIKDVLDDLVGGKGPLDGFRSGMNDAETAAADSVEAMMKARESVEVLGGMFRATRGSIAEAVLETGTLQGAWDGLVGVISSRLGPALANAAKGFRDAVSAAAAWALATVKQVGSPSDVPTLPIVNRPASAPVVNRPASAPVVDMARERSLRTQAALGQEIGRIVELAVYNQKVQLADSERLTETRAIQKAISSETVGIVASTVPVVKEIAKETGKAGKAAKTVTDEFAKARDVLADQRDTLARLTLEWESGAEGSEFVRKEFEKLEDALRKSGVSMKDFLEDEGETEASVRRRLEDTEAITEQLKIQENLSKSISGGLGDIAGGDVKGGLEGILGGLTETVSIPFQKALDDISGKLAKSFQNLTGGGSNLDSSVKWSAIGTGLGTAASGALAGDAQQIGSGLGAAAGAAIGSAIPVIGTALGSVIGGAAGGFMSKFFGKDAPTTTASGTAFAGTDYAQANSGGRRYTDEKGKTGALDIVQSGLRSLLENFDKALTDVSTNFVADVKSLDIDNKVKDIDAARLAIAQTLSDTIYEDKGASETAAEIERRVDEFMKLSVIIATAGKVAATETQVAFREIADQFSKANVEILRAVGFSMKEIERAKEALVSDLRTGVEQEMLDTLIELGKASKDELQAWRALQFQAVDERKAAAVATARDIGADVDLVRKAFRAERGAVTDEYGEMLRGLAEKTVEVAKEAIERVSRLDRTQGAFEGLSTIASGPNADSRDIRRARRAEMDVLQAGNKERIAEAKRLGLGMKFAERVYNVERDKIVDKYSAMLRSMTEKTVEIAKEAIEKVSLLEKRQGAFEGFSTIAAGPNADSGDIRRAQRAELDVLKAGNKDRIEEAKRLGLGMEFAEQVYNAERESIIERYTMRLAAIVNGPLEQSIARFAESIGVQTQRLSELEGERAGVLGELQQRSDAMRQAEQSLADTRAQLARSTELTPGGPMQQLAELRRQFDAAIRSARGGDTDAAATASGLAQEVLGAGRDVYASSGAYASLFRGVNADLLSAQGGLDKRADQIDAQLDKETFADVTEKSTMALLKALGTLNGSIAKVEGKIADQTRAMERAETKRRIA